MYKSSRDKGSSVPTIDRELFDPFGEDSGLNWEEERPGVYERVVYEDEDGQCTRFVRMEPGAEIPDRITHDFYEEVFIIEGGLIDTHLDEVFTRGMYCCRTPGMEHGPYVAPIGCLTIGHRYYD
ncbi:hypothetical protein GJR96_15685 [Haloferax sp. MBLA0076]|uniref:ChrR-like cupin domain-containing protein n=1 Tax=Haloferax litoreum TaxID=2666140 RepID=A0A6A8GJM1_9EURY|nr:MULTISPECIES: cupin domain-containing protein [Haloferax]KAB1190419.1 hypothetical protein Hfx1148_15615 [Haloferax sp. CBA1148]MRX23393.1 hypothetical protein [Haloferax litoreum]